MRRHQRGLARKERLSETQRTQTHLHATPADGLRTDRRAGRRALVVSRLPPCRLTLPSSLCWRLPPSAVLARVASRCVAMHLPFVCLLCLLATADGILVRAANRTRQGEARETYGCFFGDLSTHQAFAAAAQARAKGGDLLLFNVNAAYTSLALRLVGNLARMGELNYLAIAYDAEVSRSLHRHGVCSGHNDLLRGHAGLNAWQLGPDGAFADRREKTILFTMKLQSLTWAAEAGLSRVLHLDLDIVVLQPPFLLFSDGRFGPTAFACAMDMPTIPHTLAHVCAASGSSPLQHTTVPRQRLNTGAVFVDARPGGAIRLVNETLRLILKRFDDSVQQPPPPCPTCPFPLLPDWDLLWEQARRKGSMPHAGFDATRSFQRVLTSTLLFCAQFVLNQLVETHTPSDWNVSCAPATPTQAAVPYPWSELDFPADQDVGPLRLVGLPETAVGRLCAINATLSAAAPAQLASMPLLDAWPRPLSAGHLVFTPNRVRLAAMRPLGAWYHTNGTNVAGSRDGADCFQRSEPVVLLSQSGQSVLVVCTAEPREDGRPCCVELDADETWPVVPPATALMPLAELREKFPSCLAWEWEK